MFFRHEVSSTETNSYVYHAKGSRESMMIVNDAITKAFDRVCSNVFHVLVKQQFDSIEWPSLYRCEPKPEHQRYIWIEQVWLTRRDRPSDTQRDRLEELFNIVRKNQSS